MNIVSLSTSRVKFAKDIIKKIIIVALVVFASYFIFVYFIGNTEKDENDIILRKNYLIRKLSGNPGDIKAFKAFEQQHAGEWLLVSYSMATFALTNIAMEKPETANESRQIIKKWIDACLSEKVKEFDRVAWQEDPLSEEALKGDRGHIGYYGHLNLMLSAYALLEKNDNEFAELHKELNDAIERRMNKYDHRHVETYPGETYPADNTVAVASLKIADMTFEKSYEQVIIEWIEQTKKIEDLDTGLIQFQIDSISGVPIQTYRGSHIGWNSFFLNLVDKKYSEDQFKKFKTRILVDLPGIAGFKEYSTGHLFSADRDSGPILFGLGASSTGFSVAGAKLSGDKNLYFKLLRSIEIFGISVTKEDERHYLTAPIISDAIMLAMKTAYPWKPLWK